MKPASRNGKFSAQPSNKGTRNKYYYPSKYDTFFIFLGKKCQLSQIFYSN